MIAKLTSPNKNVRLWQETLVDNVNSRKLSHPKLKQSEIGLAILNCVFKSFHIKPLKLENYFIGVSRSHSPFP